MAIKKPSYLRRLLLYSLLLGIFPVIVLGISSYWKSSSAIQLKVEESNRQLLLQSQLKVEYVLQSADQKMTSFIISNLAYDALDQAKETFRFDLFQMLQQSIVDLQVPGLNAQEVQLINFKKQWVLKHSGLYNLKEVVDNFQLDQYESLSSASEWIKMRPSPNHSAYDISLVKHMPINIPKAVGLLKLQIPSFELNQLINGDGIGNMMILDRDYTILAHSRTELLGTKLTGVYYDKLLSESSSLSEGTFTVKLEDDKHSITFRKSSYNGWIYISDNAISEMTKDAKAIGWFTFLIALMITLLISLLSWYGSKTMYSPVRKLFKLVDSRAGSRTKSRDEFDELLHAFGSLASSESNMKSELKEQLPQLKELFVFKLLQGDIDDNDIKQKLAGFGYTYWSSFTLLSLQLDQLEDTRFQESDTDLLMFAINNIVTEIVSQNNGLQPILYNRSQVTVVGNDSMDEDQFKRSIAELANKVQRTILEYMKIKVSIGISRPHRSFKEAPHALNEAESALKYRITLGEGSILFIDEVQPSRMTRDFFPEVLSQKLLDAVKLAELSIVEECLKLCMTELFSVTLSQREVQMALVRFIINFMKEVEIESELYERLHTAQRSLFEEKVEMKTAQEVETWFREVVVLPMTHYMESRAKDHYKTISDRMRHMIHEEFDTDITLESCADRLSYHPDYIKKVFRKETGINFSDYVGQYRMDMAKQWLRETDLKVNEIAEKLRYTNAQNFIRFFRKLEGKTPGQYRNEHRENE